MITLHKLLLWFGLTLALACGTASAQTAHSTGDDAQIVTVLRSSFDRPEAPLSVAPVVVVGDHAIAGWVQDKRGGRALMRKVRGAWTIHLCSGDPLKQFVNYVFEF